ncbi:MAG: M23 family metallopeptidase [Spirochaetes bacterium]|nr:M23 family metallopeptidase [Spirochaetota bacterium]
MKIYYIVLLLLFSTSLYSQQIVYIDNEKIQEYKNTLGIWLPAASKQELTALSNKYSSDIDQIYKLNNIKNNQITRKYYFISYSDAYLEKLKSQDIKREINTCKDKEFIWPLLDPIKISSVLGFRNKKFHPGLDLPVPGGKPVLASMEGLIIYDGYAEGYGRMIVIKHKNNYITRYAHNSVNLVRKGDFVKKGQIIAFAGSTGNSTGNHLHFEIRCRDVPLDPLDFLPAKNDLHIIHTLKNWK